MIGIIKSAKRLAVMNWHAVTMNGDDVTKRGHPAVLLVHGFWNNRGVWSEMIKTIRPLGIACHTATLSPPWQSIDFFARHVAMKIDSMVHDEGAQGVLLVGHSMGGLVLRKAISIRGTVGVSGIVTLATPHSGTSMAKIGPGKCAVEMRPSSEWLASIPLPPKELPFFAFSAADDLIVRPLSSSEPEWAQSKRFPNVGHNEIVADHRIIKSVAAIALGNYPSSAK